MHLTFWNSLTLIDHNFGTKSPFELKQKTKQNKTKQKQKQEQNNILSYDFAVFNNADISSLIPGL